MNLKEVNDIAESVVNVIWPFVAIAIPMAVKVALGFIKEEKSKKAFESAIDVAYLVVHQMSRKTDTKLDDKLSEALKVIKDTLGRELTSQEKTEASLKLAAKHEVKKFPNLLNIKEVGGFIGGLFNPKKDDK